MKTIQAYRFALDLTPGQERDVLAHAGAARVAHNWALGPGQGGDGSAGRRTHATASPDEQLTPSVSWSLPALRKAWNAAKAEVAPWWAEVFEGGVQHRPGRAGPRLEELVGLPHGQARRPAGRVPPVQVPPPHHTQSVRFTTGAIRVEPDRMHVVLPRLGRLKLHESARKLARRLDNGTARIMSATVRRDGGRWHVSFTVEVERADRRPARPDSVVGVDVGIKHLAVLSTGELVDNPRHLVAAQHRLRALGRALSRKTGPDRRTGRRPSKRWQRASARLGRAHARVANLRRDGLHKLTTRLAREHGTVVVEDLNVTGMLRQPPAGPAHRRRRVRRDPPPAGVQDRPGTAAGCWSPTAGIRPRKTCSGCGTVKTKLALSEREYHCDGVRPGPRPGPQRRTQPGRARG